ncbi:oxysterol-binding protein-related protein 9-like isoform X2 [Lineus longissimus]|uniref:oxysterol-binding protein-related protein 9-like isoform X2 n=1 Tax=Lineus longissimus TaxID=88925 RepID=UPI00315DEB7D
MGQAKIEGPLSKWTNVMKGWQYRWFVLDDNAGLLSYYTSKEKMMRGARRGCVRLKGAVVGIDDEDDSTFTITVDQKTFHFQARDGDEREKWICALEDTVVRHSQPLRKWEMKSVPTLVDFDKKLAETDAYLQLLIDQVEALGHKIDQCEDEAEREKSCLIKISAENMVEAIKQSIVYLQIAKQNTISPLLNGPSFQESAAREIAEGARPSGAVSSDHTPSDTEQSVEFFEDTAESLPPNSLQDAQSMVQRSGSGATTMPSMGPTPVPETSYSSSEDEDDNFFDAEEESTSAKHSSPCKNLEEVDEDEKEKEKPIVIASADDIFDELYDENDDEDLESLDQHGSVITHLLSQVRIGMDLTKVVLPTFILERRSLLEMFADFLAHPDIFVSIADFSDPYDRMVQTVRWYLSAFHAGRKSEVAKKPYNPILGETFLCYWDLPNQTKPEKRELNTDGPTPWAYKDNLVFIAEQVSHHPPISAFYAEHANKKISIDGYIWTKSKFLGLSIGVHMIGQAVISVVDYDEEYLITFPSGYGRSILTTPWIELGGKCTISCPKSGYSANINFLTKDEVGYHRGKPFYGGKKNQLSAEIFAPDEKKSFCNIQGEWNGAMFAQFASGRNEIFVDTRNTPIMKKMVQKLEKQGDYESRRLWRDVTYSLKMKNVEKATEGKQKLEQRQREEAKDRKERGVNWETNHFHEVGEHWVYDNSLMKRLSRKYQEQLSQQLQMQQEEEERRRQEQTAVTTATVEADVPEVIQADDNDAEDEDEAEFVDPYDDEEEATGENKQDNDLISLE